MAVRTEAAQVLITVKASPVPSQKYGDTVCVAGVRMDAPSASFIRLYPIAFRWLRADAQFNKYNVVEVEVQRRTSDTRPESYTPIEGTWKRVDHLKEWSRRHEVLSQIAPTTTCRLMRAAEVNHAAPSLGLVYPADIDDRLEFTKSEPWTEAELEKMRSRARRESETLFDDGHVIPPLLKKPRFDVRYRYRCADKACPGHGAKILDWEITELQRRLARDDDDTFKRKVEAKFIGQMFSSSRESGFYLGNFEQAMKRGKFSVLGVYWPRKSDTAPPTPTLF
ncbi:hypothetical protein [Microbacterium immunditiarum]|uniref:Uncharacterized protein n=1 Tax=Microbacterium immunditiarum TaxID=337480 RepID=A0A7Y9GN35_9MICO|nr:hypothetical protein [Microbacterium immunditiarum]NYE19454.1 hypothetical protein [Microbacterium immunditiarum]